MYRMIGADGQPYGPVNAEQLRRWIAERRARGDTLIQPVGASEWKPISSFPEFAADLPPPPAASPTPPVFAPPNPFAEKASKKLAAGICGIVLGSLGIHKFILGYKTAGIIMLSVVVGSWILAVMTCGWFGPVAWMTHLVMHVIGMVEGIIYLTKTDEEFVRTYVDGIREWF